MKRLLILCVTVSSVIPLTKVFPLYFLDIRMELNLVIITHSWFLGRDNKERLSLTSRFKLFSKNVGIFL